MTEPSPDFQAVISAAQRCALTNHHELDDDTRDAARSMLRAQFAQWTNYDGQEDDDAPVLGKDE